MIRIIKEGEIKSVYKKVLNSVMKGVATTKVYNQPNIGLMFDIQPNDESINKVVYNLKSLGFKEVDHYEDDSGRNDSYIVLVNEINGERVVCGVVYGPGYAFVTADYDDIEHSEYFESRKVVKESADITIEEAREFYNKIPFDKIKSEIYNRIGKTVKLEFSSDINNRTGELEVKLKSEELAGDCGVMSNVFDSVVIDLFHSLIYKDKNTGEITYLCSPNFSYSLKHGGFNGIGIFKAWYSESKGLVIRDY